MSAAFPIRVGTETYYRGDAAGRNTTTITLVDDNGEPVDLTLFGSAWRSQIRDEFNRLVSELDVDISDLESGIIRISVPEADSASLPTKGRCDVQATGGAISPLTVFYLDVTADGDVTQDVTP